MAAVETDFMRREYRAIAKALERRWTPRWLKRTAAILLRDATIEKPHCKFCGMGPQVGVELHEGQSDATTWICDFCARYIAGGRDAHKREQDWARFKDFAP